MVAAENGIGLFIETLSRVIDRDVVFRPLDNRKAVAKRTLVWQEGKSSEALLAFQKVLQNYKPG